MHTTGIVIGWIIVAGYLFAVLNYFVKVVNRDLIAKMPPDAPFRKRYMRFMQAVVRSHVYVPLFLVTVILIHLMIEFIHEGFFITGVITFTLMVTQILLGAYGAYFKDRKRGRWFYAHRTVAILLFCAITVHAITGIVLNP